MVPSIHAYTNPYLFFDGTHIYLPLNQIYYYRSSNSNNSFNLAPQCSKAASHPETAMKQYLAIGILMLLGIVFLMLGEQTGFSTNENKQIIIEQEKIFTE